ncbi:autotransporter outer membrane beta-barrel domain-containing protein [Polaribacter sp. IC066]|uniref:outer membrane beta-barrel protein n=1 Tax=Polaribacter sp. IC066 TaxID=57032 RepID=UPI0011BF10E3|nr:outer membrane beta-barrel protein [Polaribacter sp. IC066]TXD57717.1 autotransporter outer membrane beta-barrel domain-containing protein [Polaribacter sp. IC066]
MDQKKIDDLFKKQLQNLEATPNKRVWTHIETKLKKKKRRVFPFWIFSVAIASVLVLGFFIFPFSKDDNTIKKSNIDEVITITPKGKKPLERQKNGLILEKKPKKQILLSQKEDTFKNQTKKGNAVITKKEKIRNQQYKTVKSLALHNVIINSNMGSIPQITKLVTSNIANEKEVLKKMDIHDFLSAKNSVKVDGNEVQKLWTVAPIFAVLKSNSFSNTSPIDVNLANSTEGENSFSYGVKVAYQINKKWTVQSGIHVQEMSYSNNRIAIFSSQANNSNTEFANEDSFSFEGNSTEYLNFNANSSASALSYNGNLTQNYGYIEIPVELKYNFSTKKELKTQLVVGFSSLFLNNNRIFLRTENIAREGSASNLNTLNFSGNLGFDFNYQLNKKWSLHLNPMFKIQLNTFNENANNFAPFYLGMYTGIQYSF